MTHTNFVEVFANLSRIFWFRHCIWFQECQSWFLQVWRDVYLGGGRGNINGIYSAVQCQGISIYIWHKNTSRAKWTKWKFWEWGSNVIDRGLFSVTSYRQVTPLPRSSVFSVHRLENIEENWKRRKNNKFLIFYHFHYDLAYVKMSCHCRVPFIDRSFIYPQLKSFSKDGKMQSHYFWGVK